MSNKIEPCRKCLHFKGDRNLEKPKYIRWQSAISFDIAFCGRPTIHSGPVDIEWIDLDKGVCTWYKEIPNHISKWQGRLDV